MPRATSISVNPSAKLFCLAAGAAHQSTMDAIDRAFRGRRELVYLQQDNYFYFKTSKGVVFQMPAHRPETRRIRRNPNYSEINIY
jgi:hypothetical protein